MILVVIRTDKQDQYYHIQDCDVMKAHRRKEPFTYKLTDIKTAQKAGYEPCSKCNPNDITHRSNLLTDIVKKPSKKKVVKRKRKRKS